MACTLCTPLDLTVTLYQQKAGGADTVRREANFRQCQFQSWHEMDSMYGLVMTGLCIVHLHT